MVGQIDNSKPNRGRRRRAPRERTRRGVVQYGDDAPNSVMTLTAYNEKELVEKNISDLSEIKKSIETYPVTWVNVQGLKDSHLIDEIGKLFGMHHLILEDVMTYHQRAKVEVYGDQYFIVCHMLHVEDETLETDQLNIFVGHNFVITFHDRASNYLEPARERIRKSLTHVSERGPGYLAYLLLDAVIDRYFPLLEKFGEALDELEDKIIDSPTREALGRMHVLKRNLLTIRRSVWPLREAVNSLIRDTSPLFTNETIIHLRDCSDHAVQIIDFVETYRELAADLMDVYLSSISNKMNEVMKVLTIITTICVPPGLIAAIYGMNFRSDISPYNMPELSWYYGYPFALLLMLLLSVGTIALMWWKGWLGSLTQRHIKP